MADITIEYFYQDNLWTWVKHPYEEGDDWTKTLDLYKIEFWDYERTQIETVLAHAVDIETAIKMVYSCLDLMGDYSEIIRVERIDFTFNITQAPPSNAPDIAVKDDNDPYISEAEPTE